MLRYNGNKNKYLNNFYNLRNDQKTNLWLTKADKGSKFVTVKHHNYKNGVMLIQNP